MGPDQKLCALAVPGRIALSGDDKIEIQLRDVIVADLARSDG